MLINKLSYFYEKNYDKQRTSLMAQLTIFGGALIVLMARFALEYIFCLSGNCDNEDEEWPSLTISLALVISIVVIADLLPILAIIICMWISSKG